MKYRKIDIAQWKRKGHFQFFKGFDEPFFGVTFEVECGEGYRYCKEEGLSFFIYSLYGACAAVNAVEELRTRIKQGEPVLFDSVGISSTINRADGTFGFSYINFHEDFAVFKSEAEKEIDRVRANDDLVPSENDADTIHFSVLPWLRFTSLSHARHFKHEDSVPKISFGKLTRENDKWTMPVSVHVHHALADGYHVGLFAEQLTNYLNTKH